LDFDVLGLSLTGLTGFTRYLFTRVFWGLVLLINGVRIFTLLELGQN
jgi:hypothetical protein